MSNLGLRRALSGAERRRRRDAGRRPSVTRRWRSATSRSGESNRATSVFADLATTGDGVLTGLIVCDLVARRGAACRRCRGDDSPAQVLVNGRLEHKVELDAENGLLRTVREIEAELGDRGAGCSCAPRAPSRSCASWSKSARPRRKPRRPRPHRRGNRCGGRGGPGAPRLGVECGLVGVSNAQRRARPPVGRRASDARAAAARLGGRGRRA